MKIITKFVFPINHQFSIPFKFQIGLGFSFGELSENIIKDTTVFVVGNLWIRIKS